MSRDAPGKTVDAAKDRGAPPLAMDARADAPVIDREAGDAPHAHDAGTFSCRDDQAKPGTPFVEGGSTCTLPDGGTGIGEGSYGCVDPTTCACTAQAGASSCKQVSGHGVCVYATCNGADEGEACDLGGSTGVCCQSACAAHDFSGDPENCGGCGIVCPSGVACAGGQCATPCTPGSSCGGGLTCEYASTSSSCGGMSCTGCFPGDCTGEADGAPCAIAGGDGICCNHSCVQPTTDNSNCGGCGISCCTGTTCSPVDSGIRAVCL